MAEALLTLDHDVANKMLSRLEISAAAIMFSGDASRTEYLLHEVGHALSLKIEISSWAAHEIEERLSTVQWIGANRRNEARVLAAESILYSYTDEPIDPVDLREVAEGQNVPRSWLAYALGTKRTYKLALQLARWALEWGILEDTGAATKLVLTDLRRKIRATPLRPRSSR